MQTLAAALAAHREQRFAAARDGYVAALRVVPALADALHMLGVVHLQTGEPARAVALLLRAAEAFDWSVPAVRHNLRLALAALLADHSVAHPWATWLAYREAVDARRRRARPFAGRISVVVPAFNHAQWVGEALDSLATQTRPPDEIVVVDDGSTDGTAERIRAALSRCSGRTRFLSRSNRGAAATINEAVALTSGDYVNVLNSDDRFPPTRLATMAEHVAGCGAAWGFSRATCIGASGEPVAPGASERCDTIAALVDEVGAAASVGLAFLSANPAVSSGSLFFARTLHERLGGFADLRYNHDWDFCLRASLFAEPVFVARAEYDYRLHDANTITGAGVAAAAEAARLFERFHAEAAQTAAPGQPFAPVPAVWGAAYWLRLLQGGQPGLLPPDVLRACAKAATRIAAGIAA